MPSSRHHLPTWARGRVLLLACASTSVIGLAWIASSGAAAPPGPAPQAQPGPERALAEACRLDEGGVKAPLRGIVSVGRLPGGPVPSYVGGLSVSVTWAELQPAPGGGLQRPNAIDAAVELASSATVPGACPLGVKVRVLAGVEAPEWAKQLGGPPVEVTLPQEGLTGSVPRFWTPPFGRAYDALQAELAQTYDAVAEVREVVMSRCTTFYAEPMLRQVGSEGAKALLAAGLDQATDRACQREQVDAHAVWERTPSSLALNPYVRLTGEAGEGSLALPLDTADHCRAGLGARCILANNSIRWPPLGRTYLELYEAMEFLGPPLEFQTASPRRIGDATATLRWAAEREAGSVELEPSLLLSAGADFELVATAAWGLPPVGTDLEVPVPP